MENILIPFQWKLWIEGIDVAAYSIKNAIWYDRILTFKSEYSEENR
ncbi:MAG: hypothetical protein ACLSGB_09335 [Dorea sp.]